MAIRQLQIFAQDRIVEQLYHMQNVVVIITL